MAKLTPEIYDYIKRLGCHTLKRSTELVAEKFGVSITSTAIHNVRSDKVKRPRERKLEIDDEVKAFVMAREGTGTFRIGRQAKAQFGIDLTKAQIYAIWSERHQSEQSRTSNKPRKFSHSRPSAKPREFKLDFSRISIPSSTAIRHPDPNELKNHAPIKLPTNKQKCATCDALATVDKLTPSTQPAWT